MSTLGRNIAFPIYNGDGTSFHNLVIKKSTSDSIVMSLGDKVTGDVYYKDNTLECNMDEYILVDGVKYSIVNPPTIVREGLKSENGDLKGMTKYSFEFYHPMYMLGNMAFSDVAVTNAESMFKSHDRTFSWIGNLTDYVAKLNKNLQNTQFVVSISSSIDTDSRKVLSDVLSFTNNTIADALKTAYDTWHFPFVVDAIKSGEQYYSQGKRFLIQFGNPTREILDANNQPFVFHFGKGVGLKNNSRTPRNNKIVTRVVGYGSEQNIPYGYPQIPWTGDPSATQTADGYPIYEGIVGGVVTKLVKHPFTRTHLMPSVYAESVRKKVDSAAADYDNTTPLVDYYDAPSTYPNPINLAAPKLDIVGIETIKPELGDMAILGVTPLNNDLTPASGWDDTMDDDGNYTQSYFKITLPQLDFDIYACASITEEMKINMRSGACIGCTFDAQVDWDDYKKNFFDAQGNFLPNGEQRDLTKYPKSNDGSIDIVVKKDLNTYGTLMPNVYQHPSQGDKFVILGISMPSTYITNAEERLDAALMTHMLDNNVYYYDYPLKFDEDFFYNHTDILSQVRPNSVLRFTFGGVEKSLYIKQITIKYGEGVLPKYDITLTDNIEVVLNQIGLVADDVSRLAMAMMQMNKRTNINITNTESLQRYVDYTIMPNLESLQKQIDGSQVTYFGNEDPFDSTHPYSDGKYIVDPTKFPASEWDDDYSEHDGDMFYNRETGKGYEFTIIDNSSSPVVYGWQLIQDEDIVQALNNAQTAQDTADGKRRVFICDASHHTPNPPYDVGDLWVNVKYPYSTGATYDDEILKCVVAKTEGQSFSINDWSLANGYTAALRNFINGTYADDLEDIQNQIDGKAETWYQNTDPSTAWTTTALKNQHKGDIWHNSSTSTINGVKAGQDAIWNGTAWSVDETVPQAVYDEIDGKCAIYVSWGAWGNDLQEKDLFIPAADTTQGGITYKANKVYRCVDKDTPLFQEIAYTDDTQYNGFITKLIGSSGQTKDAAENAIAAIKHALSDGNTYNEGGLILSNLISLGTGNPTSGTFTPWAGISGIYKTSETGTGYKGHGIAAWFGGGMVDGEVSQSATNAAKSLFRFDGSGYVAGGNLSWDKNGNVTIQGYSINATTLQVGGSNVATQAMLDNFVSKAFFNRLFTAYDANGNAIVPNDTTTAISNLKLMVGTWTEQFLSALGMNSQGGGTGGGGVSSIRVSSSSVITPDSDGIVDLTNYVSTANERNAWNTASTNINTLWAKVPSATFNTGNELADKAFVNSSISTATATFRGTNTTATTESAFITWANGLTHDLNDYVFWKTIDDVGNTTYKRYKYDGSNWVWEYDLNNSSFTADQWNAINSGITTTLVSKLNGIAAGAQVNVLESVKINGTALSISSKAVDILTGNGLQSSTNTISIKLATNSGLSVSSSGLKLDVVNTLDSTLTYKALSAAQGKSLNDRLAILESWFEVDADGNVKTKDKPNNGGHRGFYTESFVSALGSNSSGGGTGGGGTVTGIIIGSGNPILPDSNGSVTIPAYPTSVTWANVTGKPSWIGSSKPTYSLSEISGTDDLQKIEALTGTSGLLKKTDANTWALDTNTYATQTWVSNNFNNYTLPLAASGTRGGVQIGYSESNSGTSTTRNYAVKLSSEKMYVNVPWENTTYESKSAASGGTAVSLVTTGEKYTWNNKQDAISDLSTIRSNATNGNTAYGYFTSGGAANNVVTTADTTNTLYVVGVTSSATTTLKRDTSITIKGNALSAGSVTTTGNVSVGGTLGVTGATTLSSTLSVASGITLTTTKKITFGTGNDAPYIELDSNGYFHFSAGLYSDSFVSALGANSQGGGGSTFDEEQMWQALDATNEVINTSHIPDISAVYGYAKQSWVTGQNYATQTWVNTQLGNYLPLSGGTLTSNVSSSILTLYNPDNSYAYQYFRVSSGVKASVGYYSGLAFVSNKTTNARIGVTDTGVPQYWSSNGSSTAKTLLHGGNTYVTNGVGYIEDTEITTISGNAATATALAFERVNDMHATTGWRAFTPTNSTPSNAPTSSGWATGMTFLPNNDTGGYRHIITFWGSNSNNSLWIQNQWNGTWGNWRKVLDSANSYVSSGKGYINGTEITTVTTASKLGSTTVGGANTPIYLNNGTPTQVTSINGELVGGYIGYSIGGFLVTHPEVYGIIVPYVYNDLAFLSSQGGSCTIYSTTDTDLTKATLTVKTDWSSLSSIGNLFDGSPLYWSGGNNNATAMNADGLIIDITLPNLKTYANKFYIDFGNSNWGFDNIDILLKNSANDTNYVSKVSGGVINEKAEYYANISHSSTPQGGGSSVSGFDRMRIHLYGRTSTGGVRIAQIGLIQYNSLGQRYTSMSRGYDDYVYRSITPNTTSTYSLGTSARRWNNIYGTTLNLSGAIANATTGSFTSNVSVGGALSVTSTITSGGNINVTKSTTADSAVTVTNSNGSIEIRTATNRGIYDVTENTWVCAIDGTNTFMTKGNVGIGTTEPTYKLHVAGTFRASGNSNIGGTFGVTGATTLSSTLGVTGATTLTGLLTANGNIKTGTSNGAYIQIGAIKLVYDSTNNALKVIKSDDSSANFYATGAVSALGSNDEGGGSSDFSEDLMWAALQSNTGTYANAKIDANHIPDTSSLYGYLKSSSLSGYVNAVSTSGSGNAVTSVTKSGNTITFTKGSTFLTSHQTLYTLSIYGGTTKVLDFKPNANASIYIKAGGDISLTNDTTNKYITLSYTHPTNGANTTISAADGKVLSAITVNNLGHVTSVSSKTLAAADIPDISATYATASRATTLEGYFTNGVAKTAAKLNTGTTTYTAWGQTYWSSGIPQSVSGDMTGVDNIYMANAKNIIFKDSNGNNIGVLGLAASNNFHIGYDLAGNEYSTFIQGYNIYLRYGANRTTGISLASTGAVTIAGATTLSSTLSVASGITLTTTKKIYFGDTSHYLELNSTGFHFSHGVYSDSFMSALGANSSGGGGDFDEDSMWEALGTTSSAQVIASSHIPNLAAGKITSGTLAAARIPIATSSTIGGIKVGTTLAISSGVLNQKSGIATAGTYRSVTVDTYGRVTAGTNPTTLAGYGITDAKIASGTITLGSNTITPLTSSSSLAWGKLTGTPTTLSGYGITNAYTKTQVDNALDGYLPLSGGTLTGALTVNSSITCAGSIYMANSSVLYLKDSGGTNRYSVALNGSNNFMIGYGIAEAGYNTFLDGNNVYIRYGTSRTTGICLNSSGNVGIGTTSPSYKLSVNGDVSATNFRGALIGNADTSTTLETSRTIWGQSFNGSANISGNMTGVGNISTDGHIYMDNNKYIYMKSSDSTDRNVMYMSTTNNLHIGFESAAASMSTYINGYTVVLRYGTSRAAGLTIGNTGLVTVAKDLTVGGEVTASSDARKKNIISNTKFNVKDIASARSILYEWNDDRDKDNEKKIHGGSIAQDWLGKADSFLSQDNDGWYSINYGALALCSAITIAREVVKHDDEITRLKKEVVKLRERVAELEERRA